MVEGLPSAREDEPEVSGRRCSDHVAVRNRSRSEDEEPLPGVEPSDVDTSTRPNKPPVWAPEAFTRQTWSKNWIVSPPSVSSQKGRFSSMEPPRLNSRSPTAVQEASHPRSGMSLLRASRAGHAGMPAPAMVGCRGGRGVARWPASEPGCARVHRLRSIPTGICSRPRWKRSGTAWRRSGMPPKRGGHEPGTGRPTTT